jgi:uncharacterized cupin superfamily protein
MHGTDAQTGELGDNYQAHHHDQSPAEFFMLAGEGAAFVRNQWRPYKAGDSFSSPAGDTHAFRINIRTGKTVFISMQTNRPILCKDRGEPNLDLHIDPTPDMPDWVQAIHAQNLAFVAAQGRPALNG